MPATPRSWRTPTRWRRQHGVAVGAHAGFPDLWGFGRRRDPVLAPARSSGWSPTRSAPRRRSPAMPATASPTSTPTARSATCPRPTRTSPTRWRARSAPSTATSAALAIARSEQVRAAERAGLRVFSQIYADRAYTEAGTLVPRAQPGAVIHDAEKAAARVVAMLEAGALITVSGARLKTPIDSVCVHGDSPNAIAMARTVRAEARRRGRDRRAVRISLRSVSVGQRRRADLSRRGRSGAGGRVRPHDRARDPQPRAGARRRADAARAAGRGRAGADHPLADDPLRSAGDRSRGADRRRARRRDRRGRNQAGAALDHPLLLRSGIRRGHRDTSPSSSA